MGTSPFFSFFGEGRGLDTSFLFLFFCFERVGWWIKEKKKLKIGRVEGNWQVFPNSFIKHCTHSIPNGQKVHSPS